MMQIMEKMKLSLGCVHEGRRGLPFKIGWLSDVTSYHLKEVMELALQTPAEGHSRQRGQHVQVPEARMPPRARKRVCCSREQRDPGRRDGLARGP